MKNLLLVLAFCFASSVHAQDLVRFSNGTFYRGESELNWLEFENLITSKGLSPKTLRKAIRNLHQSEYPVATTFKKLGIVYLDVLLASAGAMTSAFGEPTPASNILMVGGLTHGVYTLSTIRDKNGYSRKGAQLAQQAVEEYNAAIQPAP
jgi:hypothetical protein